MSVFDIKRGETKRIVSVGADGAAGERLSALGFKKGQTVTLLAFSLFSGSVLVAVGYNRVALRRAVAVRIEVA